MAEKAFADTASPSPKRRGPSPTYFNKKPVTENKIKPKRKRFSVGPTASGGTFTSGLVGGFNAPNKQRFVSLYDETKTVTDRVTCNSLLQNTSLKTTQ